MSSNFERLQKIINQIYAENFSCLFHVPRSPYLWPRWSGAFLSQLLLRGFGDLSSKSFDFKSFGALFAISGALKYYKLELFFNKFTWILQLYVICSKHTVYKYVRKESRVLGHVEVAKVKWPQWSTCNLMNFSGAYLKWKGK